MFSSKVGTPSLQGAAQGANTEHGSASENVAFSQLACMVIGFDECRRQFVTSAALAAGWGTVECTNLNSARMQLLREPPQMVVIDLEDTTGSAPEALKSFAERAAKQKGLLMALCGNEGNAMEETWARQLGVWLYLPGVVDDSDLASLFEEGRAVAARRRRRAESEAYFPGTDITST
jgi:DNA-binding NtrC family response regulator